MTKSSRGGRRSTGAGYGGSGEQLALAGQTGFYDGNKVTVNSTLNHWEGKTHALDHEELLMIGEDGFATGYFKGGKSAVSFSIPNGVDPKKTVLTHNHPYGKNVGGRTIGGSFSNADLRNHISLGFKETRATSIEGTYSFKAGKNPNSSGFLKALDNRKSEVSKVANTAYKKAGNTSSYVDVYLKESDKWYAKNAPKYGYEYSFKAR